jgi:hypothetical protein
MNVNRRRLLRRTASFTTFVLATFAAILYSSAGIASFADVKGLGSHRVPGDYLGQQIASLNPFIVSDSSSGIAPAGFRAVNHNCSGVMAVAGDE